MKIATCAAGACLLVVACSSSSESGEPVVDPVAEPGGVAGAAAVAAGAAAPEPVGPVVPEPEKPMPSANAVLPLTTSWVFLVRDPGILKLRSRLSRAHSCPTSSS